MDRIDWQNKRDQKVVATRAGFFTAPLNYDASSEARASVRMRERITGEAIRLFGLPFVESAGEPDADGEVTAVNGRLGLTQSEARSLASKLSRSRTRNRIGSASPRGRRRNRA